MEESIILAKGRITRTTFWTRWLVVFIVNILLGIIMESAKNLSAPLTALSLVLGVFMIIQGVKRMHDVNKSEWYFIIPIYNLILALTDGSPGPNEYGEDPKRREAVATNEGIVSSDPGTTHKTSDRVILGVLIFLVFKATMLFGLGRAGVSWMTPTWIKYIYVAFDLIWICMLLLLAGTIKNKDGKIIGIILAALYSIYIIYNTTQWFSRL